ncbi:MAG TPA: NAD(P)-dependent oxidoreductase [Chloroflexota bacterium]|jgi:nucleoside-diphosphate-sugar epimerase
MTRSAEPTFLASAGPESEAMLEEYLSRQCDGTIQTLARLDGDVLVLGAGGKMGFSLCSMARRSLDAAGQTGRRVIAVSRFGEAAVAAKFREAGVTVIACDLLDDGALAALPDAPNVLYLAGMKFGSSGNLPTTWALNTFLPGLVAQRFRGARIVALSTGNVYAFSDTRSSGAKESDPPAPVGEYAQSCLGRERMFTYFAEQDGTPTTLIRLNYANDLRYGVILDIARAVFSRQPVDVTMGHVNVIWQGDADAAILQSFSLCASPPAVLNVCGPQTVAVRDLALRLAELLGAPPPTFTGKEAATALLSDGSRQQELFGAPRVPLDTLLAWTARWLQQGGRTLQKPTGFEKRDGKF